MFDWDLKDIANSRHLPSKFILPKSMHSDQFWALLLFLHSVSKISNGAQNSDNLPLFLSFFGIILFDKSQLVKFIFDVF